MELITPALGLVVWMGISFGLVLLILRKYAWKPILATIRTRERTIVRSLLNARHIEEEMQRMEALKRERMEEAERLYGQMLERARAEAKDLVDKAVSEARQEAAKLLGETDRIIKAHKRQAMLEIRDQIAGLSVEMAERVLQEEFRDKERNTRFVNQLLDQMILN